MGAGRPTVMTAEVIGKLEEGFALGCTDLEACFYADIGKDALYDYCKKHSEFSERKELLKQRPVLLARQSVINGLKDDPKLALAYLERVKRDEFSLKQRVNLGADESMEIKIIFEGPEEKGAQYEK